MKRPDAGKTGYTDRFLAYCRATGGLGPEATLARDAERWPGGPMTGYLLWSMRNPMQEVDQP